MRSCVELTRFFREIFWKKSRLTAEKLRDNPSFPGRFRRKFSRGGSFLGRTAKSLWHQPSERTQVVSPLFTCVSDEFPRVSVRREMPFPRKRKVFQGKIGN
uniref:Uncharacterized protein n=1 Tax=Toxoplasma gondii (strain ATCC 50861 / VEG) TaxID=432359 RepID=A0A0F7V1F1_TOXGV|nr:TPA: hypothetical protein BN1205_107810 [Toxoplasma gondii VEG]